MTMKYYLLIRTQIFTCTQPECTNSIIASELDSLDLVAAFPKDLLQPNDYSIILDELTTICKNKNNGPEGYNKETGLKETTMNRIFAIFIYNVARNLKEPFYKELTFFLMMYRRALNEFGWTAKGSAKGIVYSEAERRNEYCAVNTGEYALDVCNDFITESWTDYMYQYDTSSFKVIGTDTGAMKNTVFLTQYFCSWLWSFRYSNSRLQMVEQS